MARRSDQSDASTQTSADEQVRRMVYNLRRPIGALFVLGAGIALFSSATAPFDRPNGSAPLDHAQSDAGGSAGSLHALPMARSDSDFDTALARLKAGPFGVELTSTEGADLVRGQALSELAAAVVVDAALPPLRIEIMGLAQMLSSLPSGRVDEATAR